MQESQIKSLIVLVNGVRLSIQQHIDAGTQVNDIVAGTLVREGMCQECAPCDNGYYLKFCNKFDMGACFMCRDSCSREGFFLSHVNSQGCVNRYSNVIVDGYLFRKTEYVAEFDYDCQECRRWRKDEYGAFYLLVGCAGDAEFTRWHPRAQADPQGKLTATVCPFDSATGKGNPDLEQCFYRGKLLERQEFVSVPSGETLTRQAYTSRMPYCPPGWRVDGACLASKSDTDPWDPACCVRCRYCDYLLNQTQVRSATWRQCSGLYQADTQTCAAGCMVGEYIQDGKCTRCRTCGE